MDVQDLYADAELQLARFKGGDENASIFLRKRLYNLMLREAYSVLSHAQDAEDAVEDSFARLWRFRDKLPADWIGAKKYVLRIVHNVALDKTRLAESRIHKVELHEEIEAAPQEVEDMSEKVYLIASNTAPELFARLGRRHQRIFSPVAQRLSRPYDDVQQVYQDVAAELGTSSAYVRNVWSEIGKELKATLPSAPPEAAVRELLRVIGVTATSLAPSP
jgi:DNA-directed RNA polymerase specialized sigma24 family protein